MGEGVQRSAMFKDLMGKEFKIGDHILYFKSWANKDIEEAIVIQCDEKCVKVEHFGKGSPRRNRWQVKKEAGKKSRLTATDKNTIIISSDEISDEDRNVFEEASSTLMGDIKRLERKLKKSLQREQALIEENELLQAEVEKIHSRYNILDL